MAFLPDGESLAVAFQHGGAPKFGAGQAGTSLALAVVPMADALVGAPASGTDAAVASTK